MAMIRAWMPLADQPNITPRSATATRPTSMHAAAAARASDGAFLHGDTDAPHRPPSTGMTTSPVEICVRAAGRCESRLRAEIVPK
ncbi:hypothetical protein K3495_g2953 [Podosphaera aphanis]|nr:hypothetical protein K3495_g2953 [Podosphaera aphanis]